MFLFFCHDLEWILPDIEAISLALEEESECLCHLSRSLLQDHSSILIEYIEFTMSLDNGQSIIVFQRDMFYDPEYRITPKTLFKWI